MLRNFSPLLFASAVALTALAGLGAGVKAWDILARQSRAVPAQVDFEAVRRSRNPSLRQRVQNPFVEGGSSTYYLVERRELAQFLGTWCIYQWRSPSVGFSGAIQNPELEVPDSIIAPVVEISSANEMAYVRFSRPMLPRGLNYEDYPQPSIVRGIKALHDLTLPMSDSLAIEFGPYDDGDPFDDEDRPLLPGRDQPTVIRQEDMIVNVVVRDPSGRPVLRLSGDARRCPRD